MDSRPTIHLRSAAYVIRHRADFPAAYSIQRAPRLQYGEGLDGFVEILRPTHEEWERGEMLVRGASS